MSKYGYGTQYAEQLYGTQTLSTTLQKNSLSRVPLGLEIRKSVGKKVTFRRWTGNGFFDSVAGKVYQSKQRYVVPSSINNIESAAQRQLLAAAVAHWKNNLSAAQKQQYNNLANHGMKMSGYNLFIKKVLLNEVSI